MDIDSRIVQVWTSLGVGALDESEVTQVSEENICLRASALVDSVAGVVLASGNAVFVYRLGTTRLMVDRGWRMEGEYRTGCLFDASWTFISDVRLVNQRP